MAAAACAALTVAPLASGTHQTLEPATPADPAEEAPTTVFEDSANQPRAVLMVGSVNYGSEAVLDTILEDLSQEGRDQILAAMVALSQRGTGRGLVERFAEWLEQGPSSFVMLFTPNAMRMNIQGQSMVWINSSPPTMAFADDEERRVLRYHPLTRTYVPTGASDIGNIDAFDDWREIAGARAQRHKYGFKVSAGKALLKAEVTTDGEIWLAPDHPGAPIVAAFYRDFAYAVIESGWFGLMGGGLTLNLAAVAQRGLPLAGAMTQQTVSRAAPIPIPAGSAFEVALAVVLPADADFIDYIQGGDLPDDYELVEITSQELPDLSRPVRSMRRLYFQQLRESDTGPGRLLRRLSREGGDEDDGNGNDSDDEDGDDGDDGGDGV